MILLNYQAAEEKNIISAEDGFDILAVKEYLAKNIEGFPNEPLVVEQYSTGLSNLTYLIRMEIGRPF